MATVAEKLAFRTRCGANGEVVESLITHVYTNLSQGWTAATMIDGGAHKGYHTFRMADLATVNRVLAVEASPPTMIGLAERISRHPQKSKILAVEAALQDDPALATVTFNISDNHPGRSGINPIMQLDPKTVYNSKVTVPATTLDKVGALAPSRVRFIKLDLEGAEFAALRGGAHLIATDRPVIVFENGQPTPGMNGYTIDDVLRFWTGLGYQPLTVFGEPMTTANAFDMWYGLAYCPATDPSVPDLIRSAPSHAG